jgi:2-polyprenyl-6-methoxyphenol hydroxylase-like FAD-dependent oxidoreductase
VTRSKPDYDAVIVGASLAGCATAILLGRAGLRVALVEKQPHADAFKRICSHVIQPSAMPTLERLDLFDPIMAAGGIRTSLRTWTRWGWIAPPPERAHRGVNLRRERLDPIVREAAASTPGVELMLGLTASRLVWDEGGAAAGVLVRDRDEHEALLGARLVVGADGRDSRIAELGGVASKSLPHGRFVYAAYYEGALPAAAPDYSAWFLDPHFAAAFPTDEELVIYAALPTKERLPEFRRDPESALVSFIAGLPEAPPIRSGRRVSPVIGKLDMTNRVRGPIGPGIALAGDAALATDPLFGVGCGWALQSAEWLADSVAPALNGAEPLDRGLERYRRRHRRELRGHAYFIHDFATGRRMRRAEHFSMAAAARDPEIATTVDAYATRCIGPTEMFRRMMPRALAVNARHAIGQRRRAASG